MNVQEIADDVRGLVGLVFMAALFAWAFWMGRKS